MEYPSSGVRTHIISDDKAEIGKALVRGSGLGKTVMGCPETAKEINEAQAEDINKELRNLCSSKEPSILRGKNEESLLSFK